MDIGPSSVSPEVRMDALGGFIDDATLGHLVLVFGFVLNPVFGVFALGTGVLNIVILAKMDLSRGVNMSLLTLSVSDLTLAVLSCVAFGPNLLLWVGRYVVDGVSMLKVRELILWLSVFPAYVSLVVTTVIAVIRCLCVAFPLSLSTALTVRRQFFSIVISCLVAVSVPVYYCQLYISSFTYRKGNNSSQISSPDRKSMAVFDVFRSALFVTCFSINVFSLFFLTVALRRSSKFRASGGPTTLTTGRKSMRDSQVVKTVILLLVIFVSCNVPLILLSALRQWIPELHRNGRYRNERAVLDLLVGFGVMPDASLKTFVYLYYNKQFKDTAKSVFRFKKN